MRNLTIPAMKTFINAGMNVLIVGRHGTGKTQMAMKAINDLKLKHAYYSASTLDPYTDLVGVPVPVVKDDDYDNAYLKMVRPKVIDEVEVIIWDEANRADTKTLNAMFEITQFKTINGEPLPNLKSVVIAMNPNDGDYVGTSDLDPAFVDRFDASFESNDKADLAYLKSVFPTHIANALYEWHSARGVKADYVSPRRLEKIGLGWMVDKTYSTVDALMPPSGTFESRKLFEMLKKAEKEFKNGDVKSVSTNSKVTAYSNRNADFYIKKITRIETIRDPQGYIDAVRNLDSDDKKKAITHFVGLHQKGTGGPRLGELFGEFIFTDLDRADVLKMISGWTYQKEIQLKESTFDHHKKIKYADVSARMG